jgi:hypothetical protein
MVAIRQAGAAVRVSMEHLLYTPLSCGWCRQPEDRRERRGSLEVDVSEM